MMKTFLFLVACIILQPSTAQPTTNNTNSLPAHSDTTFFNIESVKSSKATAVLYRITTKQNDKYLVKDFDVKNDRLQMVASCNSLDEPLIKNGRVIYYYESGKKKSEGNFVNNIREGAWTIWDESGTDSTLVECDKEGNYKNIFISPKCTTLNNQLNVLYPTQVMASFPGGDAKMQKFLAERIKFPKQEMELGINGQCYVAFTVEKDGSLTNMQLLDLGILNTIGYNNEALRVAHLMPKWKPAMEFGQPTVMRFHLPIKFTVQQNRSEH